MSKPTITFAPTTTRLQAPRVKPIIRDHDIDERVRLDLELAEFMATFYADPLGFVYGCFPWPINGETGPDVWQAELLTEIGTQVAARGFDGETPVLPIRVAVSSGHGIGKSTLIAWLICWIMSTRPHCHGTVTANTNDQLEKRTWAAVREWVKRCLTAHWFDVNSAIMFRKGSRESWFCAPASCAEENSEAFAGQQAKTSTSFYVNDEDSAVPEKIHQVEEGGLATGEPMQFLFGNPTRNTGSFHRAAFGAGRDRYTVRVIDSRTCKFSNKVLIAEWEQDYGEDSDFFKVRVRGLPPSADETQYIDEARIREAQLRHVEVLPDEPLIAGVDVSGGGSAWTVCRFRRGFDARSVPPIRITGQKSQDRLHIITMLAEALSTTSPDRQIAAMFIDSAYGSPVVERLHELGHKNVHEVNFGAEALPTEQGLIHEGNMRAYMWRKVKDWLMRGTIARNDVRLAQDLTGPGFHLRKELLVLESKESMQLRGVASPDDGDALALTFAQAVRPKVWAAMPKAYDVPVSVGSTAWMG